MPPVAHARDHQHWRQGETYLASYVARYAAFRDNGGSGSHPKRAYELFAGNIESSIGQTNDGRHL